MTTPDTGTGQLGDTLHNKTKIIMSIKQGRVLFAIDHCYAQFVNFAFYIIYVVVVVGLGLYTISSGNTPII